MPSKAMHAAGGVVLALATFMPPLAGSAAFAQAPTKVAVGYVTRGALEWPEYVADALGWFKDNGLDVELLQVGNGVAPQLAAGSLNLGHSGFPDFIRATLHGAPLKIVMNAVATPPYSVHAKPSIKTIPELKGKIFSSGGAKSVGVLYVKAFIAAGGLKLSDLDFIYAKATQDRLAALLAGATDAAILFPPASFRADAKGFTRLGEIADYMKDFPFTVWAANTDWAAKNKPAMLGFVKAYARAVRWLDDPKNKDKAVDILVKYSKQDRKDSADTYDYFFTKLHAFTRDGLVSEATYKTMIEGLVALGDMQPPAPPMGKLFDLSYVKQAWK